MADVRRPIQEEIEATLRSFALGDPKRPFWERAAERGRAERIGAPGRIVAHYTTGPAALRNILPRQRLRLSWFERVADPRENRDWVELATSTPLLTGAFDLDEASDLANKARKLQTNLLCLTTEDVQPASPVDFKRAYARPRMWEQYAQRHAGVCLVFDRTELDSLVRPQLQACGMLWAGDVHYNDAALADIGQFTIDGDAWLDVANGDLHAAARAHVETHHEALFFTKMEDYADEHEFRYVVFTGRDRQFVYVNFAGALRAVVLGEGFPEECVSEARALTVAAGTELRQMRWRPTPVAILVH